MDARTTMILAKGKTITADAEKCIYNDETGKWEVLFKNGKTFYYSGKNIVYLKNPTHLESKNYQVRKNGKFFGHVQDIFSFQAEDEEYWHVIFSSGVERDYRCQDLQIEKSVFESKQARDVFDYLKETAELTSVRTENNTAVLTKQYEKIDFLSNETAAASYLDPSGYQAETGLQADAPIFPFGCNESQFKAVTNALSNRVSVIEGPPGTGKTQTILNIIANLIMQGKTVQVVSNNNSAIENVQEKLAGAKYQMGFFVALLGKEQRKETFLEQQTGKYPDLSAWRAPEYQTQEFYEKVRGTSLTLQEVFRDKNRLAELYQEKSALQLEREHYDAFQWECSAQKKLFPKSLSSEKILYFWQEYLDFRENEKRAGFFYWLKCRFSYGIDMRKLLRENSAQVLDNLHELYYQKKSDELNQKIQILEDKLAEVNANRLIAEFTEMSLHCFRAELAKRYSRTAGRPVFSKDSLWKTPDEVLREYPVVLSTTYTARSSLGRNARFDYVIMDEASQVDVATGFLSLSCAANAVIVGDTQQLPNVISSDQREALSEVFAKYKIDDAYDFSQYSFLRSLCARMEQKIPQVTLREHYRCHPLIIGFCNQKFYHGDLIVMTEDHGEKALKLVLTVSGHHERDHMNQRQIDAIQKEVLPELAFQREEIGIIAPYKNQARQIEKELNSPQIDVSTVHKFQGREKDAIILSTVDDIITPFSDDPNLLNVAVSRAKKKLIVVASEMKQPEGSNIGDLIGYIRYHNCDVQHSAVSSVFDYLYKQYRETRLAYLQKRGRISEYDSENLMYHLIRDELEKREDQTLDVIFHQPLYLLIRDQVRLNREERDFINNGLSHLDFLIYNRVSKQPILAIEVDGYQYHKEGTAQAERDRLKNHILEQYKIPLIRFATNGSNESKLLSDKLDEILAASLIN